MRTTSSPSLATVRFRAAWRLRGFNNAAELDSNLIVIVNDNDQSIAENHGGLYRNLAELRASNGTCERNVFPRDGARLPLSGRR